MLLEVVLGFALLPASTLPILDALSGVLLLVLSLSPPLLSSLSLSRQRARSGRPFLFCCRGPHRNSSLLALGAAAPPVMKNAKTEAPRPRRPRRRARTVPVLGAAAAERLVVASRGTRIALSSPCGGERRRAPVKAAGAGGPRAMSAKLGCASACAYVA